MEQHIFGVAEVNQLVKLLLDGEPMLQNIYVRGELSNYKMYPSGHHYFTLKDPDGALRCVMFRGQASRLRFRPENGMKVIAQGRKRSPEACPRNMTQRSAPSASFKVK